MNTPLTKRYAERLVGVLSCYDRIVITGTLPGACYWLLSRTLATQTGMTNHWLTTQGLISIRDLWMKAHGYA